MRSWCVRNASMNPLMPSPGRPKITSTPQSMSRSNSTSAVIFAIALLLIACLRPGGRSPHPDSMRRRPSRRASLSTPSSLFATASGPPIGRGRKSPSGFRPLAWGDLAVFPDGGPGNLQEPAVAGVLVHQLGQGRSKGSSSNTEDVPNRKHHARGVPKAEPTPKEHEPLRLRKGCSVPATAFDPRRLHDPNLSLVPFFPRSHLLSWAGVSLHRSGRFAANERS